MKQQTASIMEASERRKHLNLLQIRDISQRCNLGDVFKEKVESVTWNMSEALGKAWTNQTTTLGLIWVKKRGY